jgi:dihydrofolate synthase/folylpolyglutamate synthase
VGLGGRLDSTNIITPMLSIITNISLEHTEFLGDTLGEIAFEKAGIIKAGVPVVIGEAGEEVVENVFRQCAEARKASIHFAQKEHHTADYGPLDYQLSGEVQEKNLLTIRCALQTLNRQLPEPLPEEAVKDGLQHLVELTGLRGRWEQLWPAPLTIVDTGHNPGAWRYLSRRLEEVANTRNLCVVLGFSNDKDVDTMLRMMPEKALYFLTQAGSERAMPAGELTKRALAAGLKAMSLPGVRDALLGALFHAGPEGCVFVGGSHFVVADAITLFDRMIKEAP